MQAGDALRELLKAGQSPLVADGGMATSLYDKGFYFNRSFEELCLTHPEAVREVHQSFKRAGSRLFSTNTFGATRPKLAEYGLEGQQEEILKAAVAIATGVADPGDFVLVAFGPLGRVLEPLGPTSFDEARDFYAEMAEVIEGTNADGFSLLGFHDLRELEAAVQGIRVHSRRPIFAHISIQDNQRTNYGHTLTEFAQLSEKLDLSVLGVAGDVGPSGMLTALQTLRPLTKKPISLLPNAGLPRLINDQYIYLCNPDYIGKYAKRYVQAGANIVGGHSGVGEGHIKAIHNALRMTSSLMGDSESIVRVLAPVQDEPQAKSAIEKRSKFGAALKSDRPVVSVEILPPRGVNAEGFLKLCQSLVSAGIDFVNIPDGARAVARMSATQVAAHVNRQFRLEAIPHFTARDRNLIGLQSDLLGAHLNGVRNLLLVTGDPPKLGNSPGATGVYDVDAIGLTHIVSRMNQGLDLGGSSFGTPTDFVIGVALNPTAPNQELEIRRLKYKLEAGADYIMTQPIYDLEAFEEFMSAAGEVKIPVIMGIWPLVSLRNAEFLKYEVPGVSVPDWIISEMEKAGESKDESLKRGLEIAHRTMEKARNYVKGFQVSAPFNRVEVAIESIKVLGLHK